jgi:hypothetical protein
LSSSLAASLTQQGWEQCKVDAGMTSWRKRVLLNVITNFVNRNDAQGSLTQKPRTSDCG